MNSFGDRLRLLRDKKGLTQSDLAQILSKKNKQVISNWELGKAKPSFEDLERLIDILETTASYLVNGIESPVSYEPPVGYSLVSDKMLIELQQKAIGNLEVKQEQLKNP